MSSVAVLPLLEQSLGHLATSIAGATAVFHQYKLDFCCGGKQSLADALAKKQLDPAAVLSALEQLQQQDISFTDWRSKPVKELIAYILERFHERHRRQLPELIRLARRVEHVHIDDPQCPTGLTDHLDDMYQELESHMMKEEQILFPMLAGGIYPSGPISVMEEEHLQHGDALEVLDKLTNNITLPADACNTWTALYLGLKELKEDLMQHILLENEILFVQWHDKPAHGAEGQVCCGSCQ
ncbi:MAG: iron-sulfur cluster repair protein YtfE [Gammaproteobacteria bacterium]|nr:iron-sulfur cluster repair protein YtfE [Gammaproteobacteria bacterium]MBU1554663.1 iron-sulfur cluster repair protein YtfE [Gammaproteobacteria bacterium]MBU2069127.1 iron-sulfur cluster repair protein YtfE [Gammaproteobacteria bacterium]MBU2182618.1 iron-sulfur cluster repair protein YtfE [Gammaproteobacteria bacterium]MBU2206545.1 iron-sulfur cluster repair protein YtfE [Gammaproteobacteria bacterium]